MDKEAQEKIATQIDQLIYMGASGGEILAVLDKLGYRKPLDIPKHGCEFCNWTGTVLNQWDNTEDCPKCKNKPWRMLGSPELRGAILTQLVNQCQTHEHRGCSCSPEEAEGCWGSLADQILALIIPKEKPPLLEVHDCHQIDNPSDYNMGAQAQWDIWNKAIYGDEK